MSILNRGVRPRGESRFGHPEAPKSVTHASQIQVGYEIWPRAEALVTNLEGSGEKI